jgi:hypothetical protein
MHLSFHSRHYYKLKKQRLEKENHKLYRRICFWGINLLLVWQSPFKAIFSFKRRYEAQASEEYP